MSDPIGPRLYIDIETYATVDLRAANVYRYRQDREFRVLMCAWSIEGSPTRLALGEGWRDIPGMFDRDVVKVAHNAAFERICLHGTTAERAELAQWDDTMARAGEWGYPQKLDALAKALGGREKDSAGTALINFFCKPNKRGERNLPEDHPEKWEAFCAYCVGDVDALVDIDQALPGWPPGERELWEVDQLINDRGIRVDLELARKARSAAADNKVTAGDRVREITGVENPASQQQMMKWFNTRMKMPNLQKETVERALDHDIPDDVREVLERRQELALTASQKYTAIVAGANRDGRIRGSFRFFGAHTGRWAGRGWQPHNLPRESLKTDAEVDAAILDLKAGWGAEANTLKALVRPTLLGPMTVVDYSAIEARVVAWLAGEAWALQAFRDGRDIYVETAERMGGLTRAQGKIAVLALGYNGAVGSLVAMGGSKLGGEETLLRLVRQWRAANPRIVQLWGRLDAAFRNGGRAAGRLRVDVHGSDRHLVLPSGRAIVYHGVTTGQRIRFEDPKGYPSDTYGGRLTENATQAVARDILGEALVRLEERGYRVVGHVHDEILVEGEHDVEEIAGIMCEPPRWASGLPIAAEGFNCARYKKG